MAEDLVEGGGGNRPVVGAEVPHKASTVITLPGFSEADLSTARANAAAAVTAVRSLSPELLEAAKAAALAVGRDRASLAAAATAAAAAGAAFNAQRRAALESIMVPALLPASYAALVADVVASTRAAVNGLGAAHAEWNRIGHAALAPLHAVFARLQAERAKARLVEDEGWLPHETMPFDRLDAAAVAAGEVDALVEAHYVDNWGDVEAAFNASVGGYDIDAEAKATFAEALAAHRQGMFRVAPRLLFPEIERVVSAEFHGGRHYAASSGGRRGRPITNLRDLRETIREMPGGEILAHAFAIELLGKLEAHLYERVEDDAVDVARVAADPVPNRHASLHGLVVYNSRKSSLNVLIMTDFIFHLVSRLKKYVLSNETE